MSRLDFDHHAPEDVAPYSIYIVRDGNPVCVYDVDEDGVGMALRVGRDEGEWGPDDRVGIRHRPTRTWIVNPFARPPGIG